MYVHIGGGLCLNEKDIIAILNMDYIKNTKDYKMFYQKLLEEKKIQDISDGKEKSMILTQKEDVTKAYISHINSSTIGKRKI